MVGNVARKPIKLFLKATTSANGTCGGAATKIIRRLIRMFIDDAIANILVNKTDIFANIHPNVFSCISIALNVPIFMALAGQQFHLSLIGAIVAARCLTDILDGAIARKYNKVSVLGGTLDTVGDISLLCIVVWFMMRLVGLPVAVYIAFLLGLGGLMYTYDFWHDHAAAKVYSNNFYNNCIAFFINNTVFFFGALFGLIGFMRSYKAGAVAAL